MTELGLDAEEVTVDGGPVLAVARVAGPPRLEPPVPAVVLAELCRDAEEVTVDGGRVLAVACVAGPPRERTA